MITCKPVSTATGTVTHRHTVTRQRCHGKLRSGKVTFTTAATIPATLLRDGRAVARGIVSRTEIALRAVRPIVAGRATLRFRLAGHRRSMAVTIA